MKQICIKLPEAILAKINLKVAKYNEKNKSSITRNEWIRMFLEGSL